MSSKKTITAFADEILQHFPPYRWDEEKEAAWAATMVRELANFSDEVVQYAGRQMVRTRTKDKTPLVAECIEACVEARKFIEAKKDSENLPLGASGAKLDHTAERLKLANELANNPRDPVAVDAAKNGWNGILHSFVRKHGRMPDKARKIEYRKDSRPHSQSMPITVDEVEWCKREAKDFDEAYAVCVRGFAPHAPAGGETWVPLGAAVDQALAKLAESMLKRRAENAAKVLGAKR